MNQESPKQLTQNRWIWLTTAGWFIGILLIVGLAMLGEIILHAKEESGGQAAVGIGMGTGVGLMQWVVLRRYLESVQKWLWFSIFGFTLSYVSFDLMATNIDLAMKAIFGIPKVINAVVALFFLTVGGPILGFITGRFIVPVINKQTPNEQ